MSKTNGRKNKPGAGRPRALTPALKKVVVNCVQDGLSRVSAAKYAGVHPSTIANEAARDPKFLDSLDQAEAQCENYHVGKIRSAKEWQASGWFLSRKWPDRWAEVRKYQEMTDEELDNALEREFEAEFARRQSAIAGSDAVGEGGESGNGSTPS